MQASESIAAERHTPEEEGELEQDVLLKTPPTKTGEVPDQDYRRYVLKSWDGSRGIVGDMYGDRCYDVLKVWLRLEK